MAFMVVAVAPIEEHGFESEQQSQELSSFIDVCNLPPHYLEIYNRLSEVPRYLDDELPEGAVVDTVQAHTLRCLNRLASTIPVDPSKGESVSRPVDMAGGMLFVHDFGELVVQDVNVVKGAKTPELRESEAAVMRMFLLDDDWSLYTLFEAAGDYLKGEEGAKIGSNPQDRAAILAKLIDSIDSNAHFHDSIHRWASMGNNPQLVPDKYYHWMFDQFDVYFRQISKLNVPKREREFFMRVLGNQMLEVRNIWGDCPMPDVLAQRFKVLGL